MTPKKSPSTHTNQTNQMSRKKTYSREFKLEALQLLKSSGKTKADPYESLVCISDRSTCGKRHSIGRNMMWNKPFQAQVTKATPRLKFIS